MIIHGKNVEFKLSEEKIYLPNLPYRTLYLMNAKSRKIPYIKEIEKYYLSRDVGKLFGLVKKLIGEKVIEILQKYPEYITADDLKVNIVYCVDEHYWLAHYLDYLSETNLVFIKINLRLVLESIAYHNLNEIEDTLLHEFAHHIDRKQALRSITSVRKAVGLADKSDSTSPNSNLISGYFIGLRNEGVAEFISTFKKYRTISFDTKCLKILIESLQQLCHGFNVEYRVAIHSKISRTKSVYYAGAMMVCIVILHDLFQYDRKFSVWIKRRGFTWFGRKDANIDRIGEFFGKRNFDICFIEDSEVDKIVNITINKITSSSHIKFLKEYEAACKYLQIKKPFFSLKSYNYYKTRCWKNYKMSRKINKL